MVQQRHCIVVTSQGTLILGDMLVFAGQLSCNGERPVVRRLGLVEPPYDSVDISQAPMAYEQVALVVGPQRKAGRQRIEDGDGLSEREAEARPLQSRAVSKYVPFSTHLLATPCVAPFRTIAVPNCHVKIIVPKIHESGTRIGHPEIRSLPPNRIASVVKSLPTAWIDLPTMVITL